MGVEQTVMFCIGAAKAGTSWLSNYLYFHPETGLRAMKEIHYWDCLENRVGAFWRKQHQGRVDYLSERRTRETIVAAQQFQDASLGDLGEWLDTFDGKTRDDAAYLKFLGQGGDAKLIGDITPSYAILSEDMFRAMANVAAKVKFVFILRDPVERLWSHLRMDAAGNATKLAAGLDGFLNNDGAHDHVRRSNYRRTIQRLMNVIPRDALHVEYYERLFMPEAIARLSAFLGITPQPADFARQINQSAPADLPVDNRIQLQAQLWPQYNFVGKFMGELPREWTERMVHA